MGGVANNVALRAAGLLIARRIGIIVRVLDCRPTGCRRGYIYNRCFGKLKGHQAAEAYSDCQRLESLELKMSRKHIGS
jgi:hypothetical protein